MTGMERNSDVVIMARYAPLFEPPWKQWNPNAILFDAAGATARPRVTYRRCSARTAAT